ncbi:aspartate-trna ligase [Phaffia rhodozyma]|uniref:Aspartate--tRNA ligase, cytoplasmic n=1 Tax=Phaffia rhodozyma TaxID=264483 RepID=A0A0F7SGA7_PHARH|nr:aspartate-trna ligase [Phaffia rhodozyma]
MSDQPTTPAPAIDNAVEAKPDVPLGEDGKPLSKNEIKKRAKEAEKAAKAAARAEREKEEARLRKEKDDLDLAKQNYGKLPLHQSAERETRERAQLADISKANIGQTIYFRARVTTTRAQGSKMVFLSLRQQSSSIQALMELSKDASDPHQVSKQMLKYAASIPTESIVLVEGVVKAPFEEVRGASVKDAEIVIRKIHTMVEVSATLPMLYADASRSAADYEKEDSQYASVSLATRLNNRVIDLRTDTNLAIFKIQSAVGQCFREFLTKQRFIEIHTPKLQGAATESGASVFKVEYFGGPAFLAQSPQLAKQMCIAGDMERVFEIAPVFRAENSNTHRHLTEFTGLDLEMAFESHYHEVLELLDSLLLYLFKELKTTYAKEVATVRTQFPTEEFLIPEKTVKLHFKEAIAMLREANVKNEDGSELGDYDDLSTANEKKLGALVREKYQTDYFILDKFPLAIRPFYTMPDATDPNYSNSYDFFMRGEEILSGAQRIHDAEFLCQKMREKDVDPDSMKGYVDAFRFGAPPHAGAGFGLERIVQFYLNLGNIRRSSLFPRDPTRLEP